MIKEINKIICKTVFIFLIFFSFEANSKIIEFGNSNSKVVVKVFSSLTCPACANFHSKIFYQLKKDFIEKGMVRFEHHPFPLDLAALNAEIILRCHINNENKLELLGKIYEKQNIWAVGTDINKIIDSIKKIGLETNLGIEKMNNCLKDDKAQDEILNLRIEAQKKYKIEATPTIFINEKNILEKIIIKNLKKC